MALPTWLGGPELAAALPAALRPVAERAREAGDWMFWQWPCRTEGTAWDQHQGLGAAVERSGELHAYLGLPWATWLDRRRVDAEQMEAALEFELQQIRIAAWRQAAAETGLSLRVHTVCQHIEWSALLPVWRRMGLTDVWLSHAPPPEAEPCGLTLHPWRLLAVNVEDPGRRSGLQIGLDPAERTVLASFVGAHAHHYLSDVRLRLRDLSDEPDCVVRVGEGWHFEQAVYGHQIAGGSLARSAAQRREVREYNELLSQSRFALCPSGAGPNTLRLWEALAVGSVPVLLGVMPELPRGGSLAPIDWDAIVLRVDDAEIASLPERLRAVSLDELRRRQTLGRQAFAACAAQRCF